MPATAGRTEGAGPISDRDEQTRWLCAVATDRDRPAFAALFGHFAPRIKTYLRRKGLSAPVAEDLTQEVMVTIWRRAETFDPGQSNANTWIFTIARNKRIDHLRREIKPDLDPNDPAFEPSGTEDPNARVLRMEDSERLRAALGDLPAEQQDLLRRAYYDDKAHSEIAEETGLPLGTVKSRIRLATARLRKVLAEEET